MIIDALMLHCLCSSDILKLSMLADCLGLAAFAAMPCMPCTMSSAATGVSCK